METDIKEALIALLEAIRKSDGQTIGTRMAQLDDLLARGQTGGLHPQLAHFLQNRSYAKALMFLGGAGDIPAGVCGGGRKGGAGA
ncbi:hypothetical protein OPIT5_18280 [Opitutaceae bacterium TAV5]|nr:hypothetical protein OPIT5_18280 [Opitutaceae bacterium TAV5]